MRDEPREQWEKRVQALASELAYPPAPDVGPAVRQRLAARREPRTALVRAAWVAAIVLALLAGLLAVPQVRAAVLEMLQIGAVRILLGEPTAQPTGAPTPLPSLMDLAGESTLAEAERQAGFRLRLPAYPPDLGTPDRVFVQDMGGPMVVLVWLRGTEPDRVRLSLHQLGPGTFAEKAPRVVVQETEVAGRPAVWTQGPYLLQLGDGRMETRRLIEGHVLIWAEGEITYRLETEASLEEAVRIAESLR